MMPIQPLGLLPLQVRKPAVSPQLPSLWHQSQVQGQPNLMGQARRPSPAPAYPAQVLMDSSKVVHTIRSRPSLS